MIYAKLIAISKVTVLYIVKYRPRCYNLSFWDIRTTLHLVVGSEEKSSMGEVSTHWKQTSKRLIIKSESK
jgi:hypothetical protein